MRNGEIKFRSEMAVVSYPFKLNHSDPMVFIGSCFSEHIALRLQEYRYLVNSNPFGVLFNPLSIANAFIDSEKGFVDSSQFVERNGEWVSYAYHSEVSAESNSKLEKRIEHIQSNWISAVKSAKYCFITLGSAWVYERNDNAYIVANCHKQPQHLFTKRLLRIEESEMALTKMIGVIENLNPGCQIVFTVSPVRHLKDGFHENNLSKSILHLAIQSVLKRNVHYYPSYELVMDDLRDYRFFSEDLVHPNELAINYIWTHFGKSLFSDNSLAANKLLHQIKMGRNHRMMSSNSTERQKFVSSQLALISQVEILLPQVDFSEDKAYFKSLAC